MAAAQLQEILDFIENGLGMSGVTADTDLFALRDFDSLKMVEVLTFLEQRFQVTIGTDDMTPERIGKPSLIASLVEARGGR